MEPEKAELIRYALTLGVPALIGLLTLTVTAFQANAMAKAAARESRISQRYNERSDTYMQLASIVGEMQRSVFDREQQGRVAPADEQANMEDLIDDFVPLNTAVNRVLLIGTKATREASQRLEGATMNCYWSGADAGKMQEALDDFFAAARADLGVENETHAILKRMGINPKKRVSK